MANHKSAKKRIKTNEKSRVRNRATISKLKTLVKKVEGSEDKAEAEILYKDAVSYIDRVAAHGKIHINTASRRKSALTTYVNSLTASAPVVAEPAKAEAPVKKAAPVKAEAKAETTETK
jgi:small subunit ribosomal protein S20